MIPCLHAIALFALCASLQIGVLADTAVHELITSDSVHLYPILISSRGMLF